MTRTRGVSPAYWLGLLLWGGSFAAALFFGAVRNADWSLIAQLRLPRALLATSTGMGLAVSGAALQALFANPLCEPYTLGISSGAAVGAVLGGTLGITWAVGGILGTAFAGALLFAGVLYLISSRPGSQNLTLLLAGVMLGFLGSSIVALWMALSDTNGIQSAIFWLLGDLSRARLEGATTSILCMLSLALLVWRHWRSLDALLMGEEGATALGVDVGASRRNLVLLVSLIIGLCVSGSGMIGFVGLVVPHFARRWVGSLHFELIPLCAIWGAASLTLADVVARLAAQPFELPVGVVTALIGAPVFLVLILKRREVRAP